METNLSSRQNASLVIVTARKDAPGAARLLQAAQSLGYPVVLRTLDDQSLLDDLNSAYRIFYRIGPISISRYELLSQTLKGYAKKELLQALTAFDKIKSFKLFKAAGLPIPRSWVFSKEDMPRGYPFVIKIPKGNQGKGVELIQTPQELAMFFTRYPHEPRYLAQEFIAQPKGSDKRIIIAKEKVVAAMTRRSDGDDFRANLHLNGRAMPYIPTQKEMMLALKATRALGLPYGGVDLIDSETGPLLLEVNPSPGFMISEITGMDVPREIIKTVMEQ